MSPINRVFFAQDEINKGGKRKTRPVLRKLRKGKEARPYTEDVVVESIAAVSDSVMGGCSAN
jgi:hypothetical protein